jgi:tetratricopeptide (TPR) repeat protein
MTFGAKLGSLTIGLLLQAVGVLVMVRFSVMPGIAVMIVGALFLAPVLAEPLANLFIGIAYPRSAADLPEEFSRVQALERNQEYDAALAELEAIIAAKPQLLAARAYRIRLLHDHFDAPDETLALLRTELAASTWEDEHHRLALLAVDLLLEQQRQPEAVALLDEVQHRPRTAQARHELQERLAALRPT